MLPSSVMITCLDSSPGGQSFDVSQSLFAVCECVDACERACMSEKETEI